MFFILTSCIDNQTKENVETSYPIVETLSQSNDSYPPPEISNNSETIPLVHPTQDINLASITGQLFVEEGGKFKPVKHAILYLAPVLKDERGVERVVSFDRFSSNRAITDENGKFTFYNVEPNKYGIVLDRVINSYLLNNPHTNSDMLFTIDESKEYNIGELRYEFLPEN